MQSIDDKICDIISTQLRKPREMVKPATLLAEELNADSLDTVEIVMTLEAEFGLKLAATEVRVASVQDVIDYMATAIEARDAEEASAALASAG